MPTPCLPSPNRLHAFHGGTACLHCGQSAEALRTPSPLPGTQGKTQHWSVQYTVTDPQGITVLPDSLRTATVLITEGYSTLADVPRILAIPRGLDPEAIQVHALTLIAG
jgi:hypothetical protein